MLKRQLTVLVAFALTCALCAMPGCGPAAPTAATEEAAASQTATAAPTQKPDDSGGSEEPSFEPRYEYAKFTVYNGDMTDTQQIEPHTTEIWSQLFEYTNTDLEVEFLMGNDGEQKAGIMIASGDYPDLIIPHNNWRIFLEANVYQDLTPYLDEYAPNLMAWIGEEGRALSTDAQGRFFSVTRDLPPNPDVPFKSIYPAAGVFYICNGALKDAGYPLVRTWDEYAGLIKSYVEKNPTINDAPAIGFSGPSDGWRYTFARRGATAYNGLWDDICEYDPVTGEVTAVYGEKTRAVYKDYHKKLFDLNQMGLLDPEFVSQTYDQYVAKLSSGRVVAFHDEWWESGQPALPNLRASSLADSYFIPMPVNAPGVTKDIANGAQGVGYWPKACVTVNCANPARAVQFFDALASEEVQKLINWGIEGQHYTVIDGNNDFTPEQWEARQEADFTVKTGVSMGTFNYLLPGACPARPTYTDGTDWSYNNSNARISRAYDDTEKAILAQYGWNDFASGVFAPRAVSYSVTIDEPQGVADFWSNWYGPGTPDVYYQKLMFAKDEAEFDRIWNEWIGKLDAMDVQPIIDHTNNIQNELRSQYGEGAVRH